MKLSSRWRLGLQSFAGLAGTGRNSFQDSLLTLWKRGLSSSPLQRAAWGSLWPNCWLPAEYTIPKRGHGKSAMSFVVTFGSLIPSFLPHCFDWMYIGGERPRIPQLEEFPSQTCHGTMTEEINVFLWVFWQCLWIKGTLTFSPLNCQEPWMAGRWSASLPTRVWSWPFPKLWNWDCYWIGPSRTCTAVTGRPGFQRWQPSVPGGACNSLSVFPLRAPPPPWESKTVRSSPEPAIWTEEPA